MTHLARGLLAADILKYCEEDPKLAPLVDVGLNTTMLFEVGQPGWNGNSPVAAAHNSTWCAVVRVSNAHGIWKEERLTSNGMRVCKHPPVAGEVCPSTRAHAMRSLC